MTEALVKKLRSEKRLQFRMSIGSMDFTGKPSQEFCTLSAFARAVPYGDWTKIYEDKQCSLAFPLEFLHKIVVDRFNKMVENLKI